MVDLWPDFLADEVETNDSVEILREQARLLEKKTNKKVKATFSKVLYSSDLQQFDTVGKAIARLTAQTGGEVLEEELSGKKDVNDLYKIINYKFEIFNASYRFRVFTLHNQIFFPIYITLDEGIKDELHFSDDICIESNAELKEIVSSVFSTQKIKTIISKMMRD